MLRRRPVGRRGGLLRSFFVGAWTLEGLDMKKHMKKHLTKRLAVFGVALGAFACAPAFAACTTTVGAVMSLTGSLGVLGQKIAQGAELAVADLNSAGGVNGCEMKLSLLDDQTSPSVGVDAAKKLVDVQQVPAIVGALSSGVSAAILTSVTAPSKVVQISPASTSPTFTDLAEQGKTGGYWFRTCPSDALQGVAMAKVAHDAGLRKVAVMYLNNPYGQGLSKEFSDAFKQLGGTVTLLHVDQLLRRIDPNRRTGLVVEQRQLHFAAVHAARAVQVRHGEFRALRDLLAEHAQRAGQRHHCADRGRAGR
ncbi:MAG: ABC transporter substrate-binding protein, partial [Proteobacteria bacterium]|nr:ABC transporter substrate-binding protein [Pseudomonadota bacterium]